MKDSVEVFWRPGVPSNIDQLSEVTVCGWKAYVDGVKYGDYMIVPHDTEGRRQEIEALMTEHAKASVRCIREGRDEYSAAELKKIEDAVGKIADSATRSDGT